MYKSLHFVVVIFGCFSLFQSGVCEAGRRAALVIGNDAYPGDSRLSSCVNDATAFADWLVDIGYEQPEVKLLTDASRDATLFALQQLATLVESTPHDQVILYFSGHGTKVLDDDGDEGPQDGLDEALVCVTQAEGQSESLSDLNQVLIRDDVIDHFQSRLAANSKQVIVILDCCFAEGARKGTKDTLGMPRQPEPRHFAPQARAKFLSSADMRRAFPQATWRRSRTDTRFRKMDFASSTSEILFLAAAREDQTAQSGLPGRLSPFTEAFLATMIDAPTLGPLSLAKLHDVLSKKLDGKQDPTIDYSGAISQTQVSELFSQPKDVEISRHCARIIATLLGTDVQTQSQTPIVEVACSRPQPLAAGQRYHLNVTSQQNGYLVVLALQADGTATIFYPNKFSRQSFISAGTTRAIPSPNGFTAIASETVKTPNQDTFIVFFSPHDPFRGFPYEHSDNVVFTIGDLVDLARRSGLGSPDWVSHKLFGHSTTVGLIPAATHGHSLSSPKSPWALATVTVKPLR